MRHNPVSTIWANVAVVGGDLEIDVIHGYKGSDSAGPLHGTVSEWFRKGQCWRGNPSSLPSGDHLFRSQFDGDFRDVTRGVSNKLSSRV